MMKRFAALVVILVCLSGCSLALKAPSESDLVGRWKPIGPYLNMYYTFMDNSTFYARNAFIGRFDGTWSLSGNSLRLDWEGGDYETWTCIIDGNVMEWRMGTSSYVFAKEP